MGGGKGSDNDRLKPRCSRGRRPAQSSAITHAKLEHLAKPGEHRRPNPETSATTPDPGSRIPDRSPSVHFPKTRYTLCSSKYLGSVIS